MRPIWSGSISFGLVSVPVRMFPATESKKVRFHFLHKKDLTPIAYEKVRRDDPVYFGKAYYLSPAEGAEKPYRLLVRALEETAKVGIAKVVIRNKQHLAALRPYEGLLLLETMYYADEVRSPQALDGDLGTAKLKSAEVEMAKSLVENLSEPFEPEKYDDTYRKELLDLIRAKAKGQPLPERQQEQQGEVVDLMTALRESVERTKKQRKSPAKRKAS